MFQVGIWQGGWAVLKVLAGKCWNYSSLLTSAHQEGQPPDGRPPKTGICGLFHGRESVYITSSQDRLPHGCGSRDSMDGFTLCLEKKLYKLTQRIRLKL